MMMSNPRKKKVSAGLSTGVKLEQYSRSILKQVSAMSEGCHTGEFGQERVHIGIEPMLLALSMEFALKAWFVWDHDRHDPIKTHNLTKLFDALATSSQERLNLEFRKKVAPLHPWAGWMEYNIRDILEHHANAFVEWRYIHEPRDGGLGFDFTTFFATLQLILDEFGKRYETIEISPSRVL